eukprot:CAMPEP_0174234694 /NCGR_PEP_ID=MMETSP0417-20130205/4377_1 /TAXON_ID=242541 /ORGANISM="Mayorella sp, Strain BSH-02190019" /LENGTH=1071 /DNA_ID=CAMNT_0015313091 /DNA_START=99 /DNA_END=3311 /DNA_ORIENTATION=-
MTEPTDENVNLLVTDFHVPRARAHELLRIHNNDVQRAINAHLAAPGVPSHSVPPSTGAVNGTPSSQTPSKPAGLRLDASLLAQALASATSVSQAGPTATQTAGVNNTTSTSASTADGQPPSSNASSTAPRPITAQDLAAITDPVQQAIALSAQQTQQQEQAQLEQVLALSRATSQQKSAGVGGGLHLQNGMNDEERQLALAAEMSLQSAQGNTAALQEITQNPTMRVRQEGLPVGLRNVGNTCYLNSMLQTYYMFQPLRRAILSFPSSLLDQCPPQQKDVLTFMRELQLLFGRLLLSNQKYVDPTAFTKSLVLDGEAVKLGSQEDVSEFDKTFLELIRRAFEVASTSEDAQARMWQELHSAEFSADLFEGKAQVSLAALEEDGSPYHSSQEVSFSDLIVPVHSESDTDLHRCLEDSFVDEVQGLRTERGFTTSAHKNTWLVKAPQVLKIQLNRLGWSAETNTYQKTETKVLFDRVIYMDRYLASNKETTEERRLEVARWREDHARLSAQLHALEHHGPGDVNLLSAFSSVLRFFTADPARTADQKPTAEADRQASAPDAADSSTCSSVRASTSAQCALRPSVPASSEFLQLLQANASLVEANINDLRARLAAVQHRIDHAYDDLREHPYRLHGVWIHQGVLSSGHYWSYLRDEEADIWLKFNDADVAVVDQKTVMEKAVGGYSRASAYFLIYIADTQDATHPSLRLSSSLQSVQDDQSLLPANVRAVLETENVAFEVELQDFEKNGSDGKISAFLKRYEEEVLRAEGRAKNAWIGRDLRLKSLFAFIRSLDEVEFMHAEILRRTYVVIFQCGLEKELDSPQQKQIEEKVGSDRFRMSVNNCLDDSNVKRHQELHKSFRRYFRYFQTGLKKLSAADYDQALAHLVPAYKLERSLPSSCRYVPHIQRALAVTALAMLRQALLLFPSAAGDALQLLHKAVAASALIQVDSLRDELHNYLSCLPMQYPGRESQLLRLVSQLSLPPEHAQAAKLVLSTPGLADLDDEQYEALALSMQAVLETHFADFADSYAELGWETRIDPPTPSVADVQSEDAPVNNAEIPTAAVAGGGGAAAA